jgi:predicted dehydrogenase
MTEPVAVGLVGAGPWARLVHAPVLAAGEETSLAGVWARRPEASEELASQFGSRAVASLDELYDACEAVAFCVPPDVQASLAVDAARAGKALLLEKPIAMDLAGAERLADAVLSAGVPSMVVLSWRYAEAVRTFLDDVRTFDAIGGRGTFVSGALLGGPFATPWRLERGALPDLGPHVLDLLDAALGEIVAVRAHGDSLRWIGVLCDHEDGRVSEASLSASVGMAPHRASVEVYGRDGCREIDLVTAVGVDAFTTLRREFAACVREGVPHELDVRRGLHLQRLLQSAADQLI